MQKHKTLKGIVSLGLFLSLAIPAKADFNPVTLLPSSFNADVIVEADAPAPYNMFTTATVDQGTNNAGNTFYEIGYNTNADATTTGFPIHGTLLTNSTLDRVYQMPASYAENNCVLVGHNAGAGSPVITNGTLTLTTPATYVAMSVLNTSGNGSVPVRMVVHYADATTQEFTFDVLDWFSNVQTPIYACKGRVSNGNFQNVNGGGMNLFSYEFFVNASVAVTSVEFFYNGTAGANGRAMFFALSGSQDSATFSPIAVTGFTQDVIMEAEATKAAPLLGYTTATMDGGTNNTANTWFERGYYERYSNSGLPAAGSTIASVSLTDHFYTMPASYSANNVAYVDTNNPTANLTFASPATYSALSFLSATANGTVTNQCIMQYADGTSETNTFASRDWFNNSPYAFGALGRVNVNNQSVNNTPDQTTTVNPRLYEAQFALGKTTVAVTNVILKWIAGSANSRAVILAVSATAGAVPPIIASVSPATTVYDTNTLTVAAQITGGTEPISYQWQVGTNGVFVDVVDGGNISGATTTNLVFSPAQLSNTADYRLIASNTVGVVTSGVSTVRVISALPDVTQPGDPVSLYLGTPSGNGAESIVAGIDNRIQKTLVFDSSDNAAPFVGPIGFIVTPSAGSTVVSGVRFYTANDAEVRDPANFSIEGSNDGGNIWTLISSNAVTLPAGRNGTAADVINPLVHNSAEAHFANSQGYTSYRVTIYNVKNDSSANSAQFGDVELLGGLTQIAPTITRQPLANVTTYVGGSPTFGVSANGPQPITYQWFLNGNTEIPDATNSTYTLANAQLSDSGKTFKVRVTNPIGSTESSSATLTVIPAPTGSYASAVLASAPVGYWRLGEGPDNFPNDGIVAFDYQGGHNGVYSNANLALPGYSENGGTGDTNTAGGFGMNAVSDSLVAAINDINFGASNATVNFSVEAWVKGPPQNFDNGIVTKGFGGGGEQFNLDTGGSNPAHSFRFFFRDSNGGTHGAVGTAPLDNLWHHVVGVCDQANSNVTLYVDGIVVGTGTAAPSNGVLNTSSPLTIGARPSSATTNYNLQFIGTIDDVAIYDHALNQAEVLNHFFAAQYPPVFVFGPTNVVVNEGTTAIFRSSAIGPAPLTYQWYDVTFGDPGVALSGQTSSNLVLANVTAAMNGTSYRVVATDPYGSTANPDISLPAVQLTVNSGPPNIVVDAPASMFVYAGRTLVIPVTVSGTAPFTYSWTSNGVTLANGGRVSGASSNVLTIVNTQPGDTATYQLAVSNTSGGPVNSTPTAVTVSAKPGFNGDGTGWGLNGDGTHGAATVTDDVLTLTTGAGSTARSAFFSYPLNITDFEATFTYQDVGGGGADGAAFILQNDARGTAALGGAGGGLGYSGITPSVALEINIYGNNTPGMAFRNNGATGTPYDATPPVDVASGHPIDVTILYNSGVLQATFSDPTAGATFTTNIVVDLPSLLGADTAYVGFSGADGGAVSTQTISNFTWINFPTLTAEVSGNALVLSWPSSVGGYALQSKADLNDATWQDVANPVVQTDGQNQVTITPLTGNQFYRLVLP